MLGAVFLLLNHYAELSTGQTSLGWGRRGKGTRGENINGILDIRFSLAQ